MPLARPDSAGLRIPSVPFVSRNVASSDQRPENPAPMARTDWLTFKSPDQAATTATGTASLAATVAAPAAEPVPDSIGALVPLAETPGGVSVPLRGAAA